MFKKRFKENQGNEFMATSGKTLNSFWLSQNTTTCFVRNMMHLMHLLSEYCRIWVKTLNNLKTLKYQETSNIILGSF